MLYQEDARGIVEERSFLDLWIRIASSGVGGLVGANKEQGPEVCRSAYSAVHSSLMFEEPVS